MPSPTGPTGPTDPARPPTPDPADFGPRELTVRVRVALGRWCAQGGAHAGRRLVVALAAMAREGAADPMTDRAIARLAGVNHMTVAAWAREWLAIEAAMRAMGPDAELAHALAAAEALGPLVGLWARDAIAAAAPGHGG